MVPSPPPTGPAGKLAPVETLTAAGSAVPGAVSALVPRPNTVDVYWVTPDGAVGTIAWFADSGWQAPYTLTPAGVAAPGAINALRHSDEVVLLYWIATDGSVASTYWTRRKAGTPSRRSPRRAQPCRNRQFGSDREERPWLLSTGTP